MATNKGLWRMRELGIELRLVDIVSGRSAFRALATESLCPFGEQDRQPRRANPENAVLGGALKKTQSLLRCSADSDTKAAALRSSNISSTSDGQHRSSPPTNSRLRPIAGARGRKRRDRRAAPR